MPSLVLPRPSLGILAFENTLKIRAEVEKRGAKVRSVVAYVCLAALDERIQT